MHSLPQRVLSHVERHELLKAGDRVGVAVSGGIDSVALLRLLLEMSGELGIVPSVVHFNHKLRGAESDTDQEFVSNLAREHNLEFLCDSDDAGSHASEERISLETAARELRYGFFYRLLRESGPQGLKPPPLPTLHGAAENRTLSRLSKIVTGHTLDDQAETVLMRIIRGAGLTGLGGIHSRLVFEDDDGEICGEIVRPLLDFRRRELEQYLGDIGQSWREDPTNADHAFTRNRLRKLVVPMLEKEFNPSITENLSQLAEIARGEEDYWDNEIAGWMGTTVHWSEPQWARDASGGDGLVQITTLNSGQASTKILTLRPVQGRLARAEGAREMGQPTGNPATNELQSQIDRVPWLVANASVSRGWFLSEPIAVQRRLVKAIGERARIPLEFRHVDEILRFAHENRSSGKELPLPLGWRVVRHHDELLFATPDLRVPSQSGDYEYALLVPGRTEVCEAGVVIEAQRTLAAAAAEYNPDQLLDADSLPGPLRVRNWRAGDRFWPAHTKSPKKIKELLQERHVDQPQRRLWPVIVSGDEVVWVKGFPTSAKRQPIAGRSAILIYEKTLEGDSPT